jgi:hypothetical protein
MSSAREHHARAEQLLDQAHAEQDSVRRGQILAEAQVHATLALSAPPETSPPSPGLAKKRRLVPGPPAIKTASTGEARPVHPAGSVDIQNLPYVPYDERFTGRNPGPGAGSPGPGR